VKTHYKHIHFVPEMYFGDETGNWYCRTNSEQHVVIGRALKSGDFGKPAFRPSGHTEFSAGCQRDIADFLDQLK